MAERGQETVSGWLMPTQAVAYLSMSRSSLYGIIKGGDVVTPHRDRGACQGRERGAP
jgi:hypothetical protein